MAVKILTGDNQLISRKVCKDVGLAADPMLLGDDIEKMSDDELADAAEKATLFARLSPAHKQRVIRALRGKGHVVGFMGDGINDAPALRAADVGISVDTATDIAKESADLILLEKDLMVLQEGVIEGRKVFANILKYIRMGASSNFGNMFSVLGASAFLPYMPMAPIQVLDQQPALRLLAGPHPRRRRRCRTSRPAAPLEHRRNQALHPVHRAHQLRSSTTRRSSSCSGFSTVGTPRAPRISNRLVRRIADDADPHHPRHPHQQNSLPAKPRELAPHRHHALHHGLRNVAALFPAGVRLGLAHLPPLYWPILMLTLLSYVGLTQVIKVWLLRKKWI